VKKLISWKPLMHIFSGKFAWRKYLDGTSEEKVDPNVSVAMINASWASGYMARH